MILTNQARGERVGGEYSLLTVRNIHFPESWLTAKGSCDPKTAFENYCWIHNNIGMQDFAIIETVEKIRDVQIAEVLAADVKPGQKVEFSGYGRKITDLQIMKNKINYYSGIDASRRFSDGLVGDASVIQTYKALTTEYVEEVAKKLTDTNYIVLAALDSFGRPKMSWSGDSGGPLVSITGGQKKIIGVFAGTLNTKDDLLKVESEYPPYTLFAKVDSGVANWISKVKAEVQVAAGDSNPAMVAFRCRFDGKLFTSFLARNEASNSYSLIASRSKNGISAKQVTGVLEGGLNEIVISLADGELRRDTKVDQVGRILLKRTNDLTEGGFSWEADGTIETTSNGRPAIIQAVCSVNGNPGVLSAFFSNKTKK
jgi:hypothetical protein